MVNQLIPPPEMEPSEPHPLTSEQRIALWAAGMDLAHEILMAGLRHKVGPKGDIVAAYREWYAQQVEEHDAMMRQLGENFYLHGGRHGRQGSP
jgi:hypothetical protein